MLREEENFDGYHVIVINEWHKSDEEIIEIYRGLRQIEDAFKVSKSDLESCPVYLSRQDHISSHFLSLGNMFSIPKIVKSLSMASGSLFEENWFVFNHADEVIRSVGELLGVDLNRKYLKFGEIKKIWAKQKGLKKQQLTVKSKGRSAHTSSGLSGFSNDLTAKVRIML